MKELSSAELRNPDLVCRALGLSETPQLWAETWAQSERDFAVKPRAWSDGAWLGEVLAKAGVSGEVRAVLEGVLAGLTASAPMRRLLRHSHWLFFHNTFSPAQLDFGRWPQLPGDPCVAGPLFYAFVLLSGLAHVERVHRSAGVSPAVTSDTLGDLDLWIRECKRRHGEWGFREKGWLYHHFTGNLIKLGRLQYVRDVFSHPLRFYRRQGTGAVVALAEDGLVFREDGQFANADGGAVRTGLWRSRLTVTDDRITGNPIDPEGGAVCREMSLDRSEWSEILRKGDPAFSVHIPATGAMDHAACGESFRQAVEWCPKFFNAYPFRAFTCDSWLLDPQLGQALDAKSNVARFMREWYLHPVQNAGSRQTYERVFDVFGKGGLDLKMAPKSSLQKVILERVKQGKLCRNGGSVLFSEDLAWGKEVYRNKSI
ncbi:MAG: acyltransferase domain-containing protein [Verrucomicrobiae bacterium]|nr:acyltransferase domain-containing protein [Verrucomicrobiae bacterium]